jgi:hypothetical protein
MYQELQFRRPFYYTLLATSISVVISATQAWSMRVLDESSILLTATCRGIPGIDLSPSIFVQSHKKSLRGKDRTKNFKFVRSISKYRTEVHSTVIYRYPAPKLAYYL